MLHWGYISPIISANNSSSTSKSMCSVTVFYHLCLNPSILHIQYYWYQWPGDTKNDDLVHQKYSNFSTSQNGWPCKYHTNVCVYIHIYIYIHTHWYGTCKVILFLSLFHWLFIILFNFVNPQDIVRNGWWAGGKYGVNSLRLSDAYMRW